LFDIEEITYISWYWRKYINYFLLKKVHIFVDIEESTYISCIEESTYITWYWRKYINYLILKKVHKLLGIKESTSITWYQRKYIYYLKVHKLLGIEESTYITWYWRKYINYLILNLLDSHITSFPCNLYLPPIFQYTLGKPGKHYKFAVL